MPSTRSNSRQNLSSATQDDDRLSNTLLTLNILYQTHIHPLLPEQLQPISSNLSSLFLSTAPYLSQIVSISRTVFSSAASLASNGSQDGSALLSLGLLLITLYFSLRVMNYIRRTIMGWVWLGIKLLLLLVMVQAGWYINSYGWDRALRNASWIGGIAWGLLEDLLNQNNGGQQRPPRGTRSRGQNNYNNAYGQRRGNGGYNR